ncbi:hypothetical protein Trydic_g1714 [Trypoxylus dichotomus]
MPISIGAGGSGLMLSEVMNCSCSELMEASGCASIVKHGNGSVMVYLPGESARWNYGKVPIYGSGFRLQPNTVSCDSYGPAKSIHRFESDQTCAEGARISLYRRKKAFYGWRKIGGRMEENVRLLFITTLTPSPAVGKL